MIKRSVNRDPETLKGPDDLFTEFVYKSGFKKEGKNKLTCWTF